MCNFNIKFGSISLDGNFNQGVITTKFMSFLLLVLPLDISCFMIIMLCCVLPKFAGWHAHTHL